MQTPKIRFYCVDLSNATDATSPFSQFGILESSQNKIGFSLLKVKGKKRNGF